MKRTNRLLLIFGVILAAASYLAVLAFGQQASVIRWGVLPPQPITQP